MVNHELWGEKTSWAMAPEPKATRMAVPKNSAKALRNYFLMSKRERKRVSMVGYVSEELKRCIEGRREEQRVFLRLSPSTLWRIPAHLLWAS